MSTCIYIYNHGVASIDNLQVEVVCAVNGLVHLTASEYIPGPWLTLTRKLPISPSVCSCVCKLKFNVSGYHTSTVILRIEGRAFLSFSKFYTWPLIDQFYMYFYCNFWASILNTPVLLLITLLHVFPLTCLHEPSNVVISSNMPVSIFFWQ